MSRITAAAERIPKPLRRALRRIPGLFALRDRLQGRPAGPAPRPGELRPVVYLPTWARWETMRQRPQYLLEAFAKAGHPVFFVDPREPGPRTADGVRIVPTLRHVPRSGVILYIHFPPLRTLIERFDDPVVIYDILDDLSIYGEAEHGISRKRRVADAHPDMVRNADVVIVSSPVLLARHRHERDDLLLVENGVDVTRFAADTARPADLPGADLPTVGFHGAVSAWFDVALFADVAKSRPDIRFVVVGPVDRELEARLEAVAEAPNVVMVGERPSAEIPSYVRSFDVGAVWFRVDTLTEAVTPLKLYEYLAAGKPVVATPLPACQGITCVETAATADEFAAALDRALDTTTRCATEAPAVAVEADWQRRLEPLLRRLDDAGLRKVVS